jgi:hypothetical protein
MHLEDSPIMNVPVLDRVLEKGIFQALGLQPLGIPLVRRIVQAGLLLARSIVGKSSRIGPVSSRLTPEPLFESTAGELF